MFFGGLKATVTAATATKLTVQPSVAVEAPAATMVTVEVANQMSNALAFELVPQGTPVRLPLALPDKPTGVVAVGDSLYVAAAGRAMGGLYVKDATGKVTRLVAARRLSGVPVGAPAYEVPTALATDGQVVFYATNVGTLHRYDPATGDDTVIFGGVVRYGSATGLTWLKGSLYMITDQSQMVRLASDGTVSVDRDPAFQGKGSIPGAFAITNDGANLYVTDEGTATLMVISDPDHLGPVSGSYDLSTASCQGPRGVAWVGGGQLRVSCGNGGLAEVDISPARVVVVHMIVPLGTASQAAFVPAAGSSSAGLLLAIPGVGEVIRRDLATLTQVPVVAGLQEATLGAVEKNGHLYLVTSDLQNWDSLPNPSNTLLDVAPDGSSRILATLTAASGVTLGPDGRLYLAGFLPGANNEGFYAVDPATDKLSPTTLMGPNAEWWDLAFDAGGNLFLAGLNGQSGTVLGEITAGSTTATTLVHLPWDGAGLLPTASALYVGPTAFANHGITDISLTGAAPTSVIPASALGSAVGAAVAPSGKLLVVTSGFGRVLEVDPASQTVRDYGSTRVTAIDPSVPSSGAGLVRPAVRPDGTLIVADGNQDAILAVAP